MIRGMRRGEDHTGHGCEHDPTRSADAPAGHRHWPGTESTGAA